MTIQILIFFTSLFAKIIGSSTSNQVTKYINVNMHRWDKVVYLDSGLVDYSLEVKDEKVAFAMVIHRILDVILIFRTTLRMDILCSKTLF